MSTGLGIAKQYRPNTKLKLLVLKKLVNLAAGKAPSTEVKSLILLALSKTYGFTICRECQTLPNP